VTANVTPPGARSAQPDADSPAGWPLVCALAAAQLVSWGSIYYAFSLFIRPMEAELGWSRAVLNGALSLGLFAAGLSSYAVGAWIDRRGGRILMAGGTVLASTLLIAWSRVESPWAFYGIWLGLGLAMAATLYEPAFAVLTRLFPRSFRARITTLTLVAGFASTVFIPLTQLLIEQLGWRHALLALAAGNLAICLPIHGLWLRDNGIVDGHPADAARRAAAGRDAFRRALGHPVFWCLALCFVAYYATFSALTFHLVPLLSERGIGMPVILGVYAAIGPSQVAGRLVVFALGARAPTAIVGRVVILAFPLALLLLIFLPDATAALFAVAVLYGAANGIMTIVRGTAVPDLLWREGYGAINGALAMPSMISAALAPFVAAFLWMLAGGYDVVLWTVFGGAGVAAVAFWLATALSAKATPK
jgi:MFS family permease